MSRTTIDQLFQITTPTSTSTSTSAGRDASRPGASGGDLFRAHLKRAADLSDGKQPAVKDRQPPARLESAPREDDEPLEPRTGQHESTSAQHDEPQATPESSEPTEETTSVDERGDETGDTTGDEVTLSAAAAATPTTVAAGDFAATAEQAGSSEAVVDSLTSDQQQATNDQVVAATTAAAAATAAASEVASETSLPGAETAEAAIEGDTAHHSDGEGDPGSQKQQTPQTTAASPATASDDGKQAVAEAKSTAGQIAIAKSLAAQDADANPEPETAERSPRRGESPAQLASPALAPSTASDTELAPPNAPINLSETTAPPTSSPTLSPNGESVAIGERSLANGLTGKAANQADGSRPRESSETPTIDRARFVQRVGGAIRTAQQRDGQIQLRLSPPELGTLKIQITVTEGAVTARLETETAAARTVLLDNLPALRERLAEQNIRIEKFDVDVGRDGQQPTDHPSADERQANGSRPQKAKTTSNLNSQELATADASTNAAASTTGGLDVRI